MALAQLLRGGQTTEDEGVEGDEGVGDGDDDKGENNSESEAMSTFCDITLITTARVPVLNFTHRATSMQFDLCVDHVLPVHNSQLLRTYVLIDPRVRPLMVAIKFWATRRSIKEPSNGGLSSYSFALLAIFFLQVSAENLVVRLAWLIA